MFVLVRAGVAAALVILLSFSAIAADKAFQRDDLADAAIKLEAQIKTDAGHGHQAGGAAAPRRRRRLPAERLPRRHAAARPDRRRGARRRAELAAARPHRAADPPARRPRKDRCCSSAPRPPPTSPISAARQPQRGSRQPGDASAATLRRPQAVAAGARCAAVLARVARGRRHARRNTSGCATSTASACSTTPSMPMPPRRGPASSSPRSCPASAPISRRSSRSPGRTSRRCRADDKQLCVEGLKHGERYKVTLRAGLPSTVKETLAKSAEFTIYVRDRKPFVRFTGKAYVLPRTGQRGIPVVSVNTKAVDVEIYRIGDRNLIDTVLGRDFQRNLEPLRGRAIGDERGVRSGPASSTSSSQLNTDVTTAFPVDQALGELSPASMSWRPSRRAPIGRQSTTRSRRNGSSSPTSA